MSYQIGDLVIGKVINVKPYALFMSFEDGSQGLLHISELSNAYIRDIEKYGTIGDEMCVKIISIDPTNGFLRVSLKQVPEDQAYNTHDNESRRAPIATEEDFAPFEKKLPEWKEITMKKIKGEK